MELLKLTGLEASCFINFDNVDYFYFKEHKIEREKSIFFTIISISNSRGSFEVEENPETILLSLKKNKFIEFENVKLYSNDFENCEIIDDKFYINVNSIKIVSDYDDDTSCLKCNKENYIEVKGTMESIYLKLKNL